MHMHMHMPMPAQVPPVAFPPEWRVHAVTSGTVRTYLRKDVVKRAVHRHCRGRLGPQLIRALSINVDLSRRKRYCTMRGYAHVYARAPSRIVLLPISYFLLPASYFLL